MNESGTWTSIEQQKVSKESIKSEYPVVVKTVSELYEITKNRDKYINQIRDTYVLQ